MGGFNLRKFVTNVPRLQKVIDDLEKIAPMFDMDSEHTDEATYAKTVLGGGQLMNPTDQKVLGLRWNVLTDCLVFSVQEIGVLADMKTPTKRKVTSTVGKFFLSFRSSFSCGDQIQDILQGAVCGRSRLGPGAHWRLSSQVAVTCGKR